MIRFNIGERLGSVWPSRASGNAAAAGVEVAMAAIIKRKIVCFNIPGPYRVEDDGLNPGFKAR